MITGKSHFVLIHGACHGAWCWYKVATLLKSAGYNVTTLDMAGCGINMKQVQDVVGSISEYHEPLMTFMESFSSHEKVILVGHSFGGISISVAMEKFPEKVSVAVFVAAISISENLTYPAILKEMLRRKGSSLDNQYLLFNGPNEPLTAVSFGQNFLRSKLYQLSPSKDLTLALSLVRPCPLYNDHEQLLKDTTVTKSKNGMVPKVYIVSKGDNMFIEETQMWMVERSGPFAEVKVIKDSDHMVMFSNPKELCSLLLEVANKY